MHAHTATADVRSCAQFPNWGFLTTAPCLPVLDWGFLFPRQKSSVFLRGWGRFWRNLASIPRSRRTLQCKDWAGVSSPNTKIPNLRRYDEPSSFLGAFEFHLCQSVGAVVSCLMSLFQVSAGRDILKTARRKDAVQENQSENSSEELPGVEMENELNSMAV